MSEVVQVLANRLQTQVKLLLNRTQFVGEFYLKQSDWLRAETECSDWLIVKRKCCDWLIVKRKCCDWLRAWNELLWLVERLKRSAVVGWEVETKCCDWLKGWNKVLWLARNRKGEWRFLLPMLDRQIYNLYSTDGPCRVSWNLKFQGTHQFCRNVIAVSVPHIWRPRIMQ